jgi:hypothetical protein
MNFCWIGLRFGILNSLISVCSEITLMMANAQEKFLSSHIFSGGRSVLGGVPDHAAAPLTEPSSHSFTKFSA